jgi:AraC-like DNA-binding protein
MFPGAVMHPQLTISLLGALQGVLLAAMLFVKGRGNPAIRMLGLYVCFFSIGLLENLVNQHKQSVFMEIIASFLGNSSYLYGPFLYLFVQYFTVKQRRFREKDFVHFIPFSVFFLIDLVLIVNGKKGQFTAIAGIELLQFEILVIQLLTYNITILIMLRRHHQSLLQTYSNIRQTDLFWLRLLLLIITGIYVFSFLLSHFLLIGIRGISGLFIIVQVSIIFCIYLMSYMALFKPDLFLLLPGYDVQSGAKMLSLQPGQLVNRKEEVIPKYTRSGLTEDAAKHYISVLETLMEEEKPFKNPDLTIFILSDRLGISKNHLTQVINEHLNMNFFQFVNMYRVNEIKRLLFDPAYSHLSLHGIALEAGYKSKATFFANFKKLTGFTPQRWLQQQRINRNIE